MIQYFSKSKIFHMASMARSGETLLLKLMNAHPQIVIVHNLSKQDSEFRNKAFEFFKTYYKSSIYRRNNIVKPYRLASDQLLLLKQGVWKHSEPFNGFILSRNPISIYSSLKAYDKSQEEYDPVNNFWFENSKRLIRWMNDMNPEKASVLKGLSPMDQFCLFYNERMGDLLTSGLPVILYEDLVTNPSNTLKRICDILKIDYDPKMLNSHEQYEKGSVGHGQNDLSKPIDTSSLVKYKNNVSKEEFDLIVQKTCDVHQKYGYHLNYEEITWNK